MSTETDQKPAKKWPLKRKLKWIFGSLGVLFVVGTITGAIGLFWALNHYGRGLPEIDELENYQPAVMTRVHAGDGSLLTEFARQQRLFVPINVIPENLKAAVLSAEDKGFYEHPGIDVMGIARAMVMNVGRVVAGRRVVGGSTITQQVARLFLLTNDVRMERKFKEVILSFRIEKALSKDTILELYLNEYYLGFGAHGVAAAARNYFNKPLNELTIAESAMIAALFKSPVYYHPVRRHAAALDRRNWIIGRMHENGYITADQMRAARAEPLVVAEETDIDSFRADYFEEEVRRELYALYGGEQLYEGGMSVRTTLEPKLQAIAERTLHEGMIEYDRRHGWRGALDTIDTGEGWADALHDLSAPLVMDDWRLAVVLELRADGAVVGMEGGRYGFIPMAQMTWARAWRPGERLGGRIEDPSDVLKLGDVIVTAPISSTIRVDIPGFYTPDGLPAGPVAEYSLQQIPDIEGALVALDPHTGRVLAMVGGWSYEESQFNRATQAERQPGSAFKPFVYAAALDAGFTPSSLVLDAPFVLDQGEGQAKWKPGNSSDRFYGPSTLRLGLEKSRNLMTVRLAQYIGMDTVVDYAKRFGIGDKMQPTLAMSLGAGEVSLLELTNAYGMLVNGGYKITPTLIDQIQDRHGNTLFRHDERECIGCKAPTDEWAGQDEPEILDTREQVLDPRIAFQMVNMLEGVVERGTGRKIRAVGKPLAGKTGTTNDWVDGWFVGFSPDLVVGVFVGFDTPRSMGVNEEGSAVAVPVFRDFMAEALADQPATPFRMPPGIRLVLVNADTGLPAEPGDTNVIFEAFIPGTEPLPGERFVLDGLDSYAYLDGRIRKGTGGIY